MEENWRFDVASQEMAWPDAMLNIIKALPNCYPASAELPQNVSVLVDQMGQKSVVQQQQQPRPKKE
jgi:hypothetical protein